MTEPATTENADDTPDGFVSFGCLDPLLAKRIMERLSRAGVRFVARDATIFDAATTGVVEHVSYRVPYPRIARINRVELFVHPDDEILARKIIDQT
jgi:hypothetical protein